MPFITVLTNMSRSRLPANFMPTLTNKVAEVLGKEPARCNWVLETDKCMHRVSD